MYIMTHTVYHVQIYPSCPAEGLGVIIIEDAALFEGPYTTTLLSLLLLRALHRYEGGLEFRLCVLTC